VPPVDSVLSMKIIKPLDKNVCGSVWFDWFLKSHPNQIKPMRLELIWLMRFIQNGILQKKICQCILQF
jgi:hypothetical protein